MTAMRICNVSQKTPDHLQAGFSTQPTIGCTTDFLRVNLEILRGNIDL